MNAYNVNSRNIVIDPISGKPMLGKNLDKSLSNTSLKDRSDFSFGEDRVRTFLKQRKMTNETYHRYSFVLFIL
jgi:hypothetical protein